MCSKSNILHLHVMMTLSYCHLPVSQQKLPRISLNSFLHCTGLSILITHMTIVGHCCFDCHQEMKNGSPLVLSLHSLHQSLHSLHVRAFSNGSGIWEGGREWGPFFGSILLLCWASLAPLAVQLQEQGSTVSQWLRPWSLTLPLKIPEGKRPSNPSLFQKLRSVFGC